MRRLVCTVAALAACSGSREPMCRLLDAKQCTEHRECLLDRDASGTIGCRNAIGCERSVNPIDVAGSGSLEAQHAGFVSRCEANPACMYEDRGCFCPCNLGGFPGCNCACGGGLAARCVDRTSVGPGDRHAH